LALPFLYNSFIETRFGVNGEEGSDVLSREEIRRPFKKRALLR
jgi:hypothetical protein